MSDYRTTSGTARDVLAKRCEEYSEEPYNLADRLVMDLFTHDFDIVPIDRGGPDDMIPRAIAIIEDSRDTHVKWVESLECVPLRLEDGGVGDIDHHLQCIEGYDLVLDVLRNIGDAGAHDDTRKPVGQ